MVIRYIRICSTTVSSRNKVFIIYEYLPETREEKIVVVSFSPLHDNLMTFFRKFPAKEFNLPLLYSGFVPN